MCFRSQQIENRFGCMDRSMDIYLCLVYKEQVYAAFVKLTRQGGMAQ